MNELDIILKVKTDLEKSMKQAEKALKKLETETDKSTKKMEGSFKNVGNAVQAVMSGVMIKAGADTIKSSERMAMSFKILETKSYDVAQQLKTAEEASLGLANKFDLVTGVNKALAFGIDLSNGRLEKLINLSAKTAVVMGTDVKSAFDDLITGTARESRLILDNLGVIVNVGTVNKDYAKSIGVTVKQLTKQQRQTALLDEVNRQLAKSTSKVTNEMVRQGTAGTKAIKKIETAWQTAKNTGAELFVELGETIGESFAILSVGVEGVATLTREELRKIERDVDRISGLKKALDSITADGYIDTTRAGIIASNKELEARIKKEEEDRLRIGRIRGKAIVARLKREKKEREDSRKIFLDAKKEEIEEIIALKKEEDGFEDKNRLDKIKDEKKYNKIKKDLMLLGYTDLVLAKKELAGKLDEIDKEIMNEDEQAEKYNKWLDAKKVFDDSVLELAERNAEQRKIIAMDEYKARKKLEEKEREEKLKHFNLLKRFGSEYLNAIIAGNAEKIPEILAQQAQMFGQELIWDGIKTLWMGTAKNALFPGLGASATAVGATEIAIGTGMVAGGMALSSATSANSDSGAGERNSMAKSDKEYNLNMEVSLFGSKTQAKRRLNDLMVG